MNLQVAMPYEKCPFNCPMCVANGRKRFHNFYKSNKDTYLGLLKYQATSEKYKDFVITGASDPSLNIHWLHDVLEALEGVHTELQTKNYNIEPNKLPYLNVLAYSITNSKEYLSAWAYPRLNNGTNRLVVLLTEDFKFLNETNFSPMGYDQITFKILQDTADEKTNKWIQKNKMKDLSNIYAIVDKYNGSKTSVYLDSSCQDSHGRYEIFRADGKMYSNWEEE